MNEKLNLKIPNSKSVYDQKQENQKISAINIAEEFLQEYNDKDTCEHEWAYGWVNKNEDLIDRWNPSEKEFYSTEIENAFEELGQLVKANINKTNPNTQITKSPIRPQPRRTTSFKHNQHTKIDRPLFISYKSDSTLSDIPEESEEEIYAHSYSSTKEKLKVYSKENRSSRHALSAKKNNWVGRNPQQKAGCGMCVIL